jgi:glycosyltransferase involved in cell wall biosynthesis
MTQTDDAAYPAVTAPVPISVVIPAHNAAWCVRRAIDSVLAQSVPCLEILVVDDGSTDDTAAVLAAYGDRIHVVHKRNGGLSSARNAGIFAARGTMVAFLDADDWWLPGKIAAQHDVMQRHPEIGFSSVAARIEDPDGHFLHVWPPPRWQGSFLEYLFHHPAAVAGSGSGVVVRREFFDRVGTFDEGLKSLEDIDMWMRLASVAQFECVDEPLAVILKRPDSMSRNLTVMREAALQVMRKNRDLLPSTLRGSYWRTGVASVLVDYAKWEYRVGRNNGAVADILRALSLAPVSRGRLCLGLLRDIALGRSV